MSGTASGQNGGGGVVMNSTSSDNTTTVVSAAGPDVIQVGDFYQKAGILHPMIIGSIAVLCLFSYLRLGSNRSVAPITVFDWIINVALGSTLAGIVNGNSLVRGIEALITMLAFQYITSYASSNFRGRFEKLFRSPPLVIAFRGKMLTEVMTKHRISSSDIYGALRQQGILNISQVECGIIEANGGFSIFTKKQMQESDYEPTALQAVPKYCDLVEQYDQDTSSKEDSGSGNDNQAKSKQMNNEGADNC